MKWKLALFFLTAILASMIFVLLGALISHTNTQQDLPELIRELGASVFLTLGSSLFVGTIFTFIIQTEGFINYIISLLKRVVISKDFILSLSNEEKKNLLEKTIKPDRDMSKSYAEISTYFRTSVDKMIDRFNSSFRGQMKIDAVAKFDFKEKRIKVEWETYHAIYKTSGKFEPIGYHTNADENEFQHEYIRIEAAPGKYKVFDKNSIQTCDSTLSDMKTKVEIPIPKEFDEYNELFVKRRIIEFGKDHWHFVMYKATKPCHRLILNLRCENGIKIREHSVVGTNEDFIINKSDCNTRMEVCYNDWLDAGYGVCAIVSLEPRDLNDLLQRSQNENEKNNCQDELPVEQALESPPP